MSLNRIRHAVATAVAAAIVILLAQGIEGQAAPGVEPHPDSPLFRFIPVPAADSGLTQVIDETKIKYPWMSSLVDIDGDGRLDILYYGHHGGGAMIWLGKGDGTFAFDAAGSGDGPGTRWVFGGRDPVWWDFTGDGKVDAVGTEGSGIAEYLFVNDGTGHWKRTTLRLPGKLIDLDGDGHHAEVWGASGAGQGGPVGVLEPPMMRWEKTGPTAIAVKPAWEVVDLLGWPDGEKRGSHPLDPRFHSAASADLDGDHRPELIVNFTGGMRSWVLARDGAAAGAGGPKGAGWRDVTAALGLPAGSDAAGHWLFPEDLDVDGDLDLIDLATGRWYANDGRGHFALGEGRIFDPAARKFGKPWDGDGEFELLDLDNDGRRDLVFGGDHTGAGGVFLNLGGGKFRELDGIPTGRRQRKFGDVDGDGDLDMIVTGKPVVLHRNETGNAGLRVKIVAAIPAEAHLGCQVWVYRAGAMPAMDPGSGKSSPSASDGLIHYRQCFVERGPQRSTVLDPIVHVGLGQAQSVDVRVRFPSGKVREARGVKARTQVEVREEGA